MTTQNLTQYNQKYLENLEKLIEEGEKLYTELLRQEAIDNYRSINGIYDMYDDSELYEPERLDKTMALSLKWKVRSQNILKQLPIEGSIYESTYQKIGAINPQEITGLALQEAVVEMDALKDDYKDGMLENFMLQVKASFGYDYLQEARAFLNANKPFQAVLISLVTLEGGLKSVYLTKTGNRVKGSGIAATLSAVKNKLNLDRNDAKEMGAWNKLRDAVAHGDEKAFTKEMQEIQNKYGTTAEQLLLKIEFYIQKYMH
jgi:hypothetical protein